MQLFKLKMIKMSSYLQLNTILSVIPLNQYCSNHLCWCYCCCWTPCICMFVLFYIVIGALNASALGSVVAWGVTNGCGLLPENPLPEIYPLIPEITMEMLLLPTFEPSFDSIPLMFPLTMLCWLDMLVLYLLITNLLPLFLWNPVWLVNYWSP